MEKLTTCTRKNLLPAVACKIELCANIWPKMCSTKVQSPWGPTTTDFDMDTRTTRTWRSDCSFPRVQRRDKWLSGKTIKSICMFKWGTGRGRCNRVWGPPLSTLRVSVSPWSTCNASEIVVKWVKVVRQEGNLSLGCTTLEHYGETLVRVFHIRVELFAQLRHWLLRRKQLTIVGTG